MQRVKCRFCAGEILDTDTVCKHCGRVLGTLEMIRTVNNRTGTGTQSTAQTATPVRVIPDAMPEKKDSVMGGLASELSGKVIGLALLGGIFALASFIGEFVQFSRVNQDTLYAGISLLLAYFLLTRVRMVIRFFKAKKFIRKNDYEKAIRSDTKDIANAIAAYKLNPTVWMVRYIKTLNAASGEIIESALKKQKIENTHRRISYIPWVLILTAGFGYFGYLGMREVVQETGMFVLMHILAFLVNLIYCKIKGKDLGLKICTGILFFTALMAVTDVSYGYHILICIAAALVAGKIGEKMHR